jgi:hypothetical protein
MLFKPCLPTRPRARWIHRAFLPDGLADNQTRHHTSVFSFWALDSRSFFLLNQAYMVLLRKKEDAMNIRDFRPISLIHSFSKLIAKVLSNQLVPFMPRLVAPNQSAFIKGRTIHDNFFTVPLAAKLLHARGHPVLLLKVDLAKAFDLVSWPFILDLLQHMGFSRRWINWILILLSTGNTKILLNGQPGKRTCHARGLPQGNPLSPLLFVLAMETLNSFFRLESRGIFSPLQAPAVRHSLSLYADDLVPFLSPTTQDIMLVRAALEAFAGASGLRTNIGKCHFTPIRCSQDEMDMMQRLFPCQLTQFPCKCLGIPLSVHKLKKADLQPLIDVVADQLPTWKASLMARAGRTSLVKAVLSVFPIHVSIAVEIAPSIYKAIDKLRRAFIWIGSATACGSRCLVTWPKVTIEAPRARWSWRA